MASLDSKEWRRLHNGLLGQMDIQNLEYPLTVQERSSLVGPLEFAQMVHANVPVKFKATATPDWFPAMDLWNQPGYLSTKLADTKLSVAETPFGNADAPVDGRYFVQPYVREMTGREFFSEKKQDPDQEGPRIRYMQSQDDNFPREFAAIAGDAPHSLTWADEGLGALPAAVNLWLGQSTATVSRLHNDNYDNVYVQVSGRKEVYLVPPGDAYALDERFLESSHYDRDMKLVLDEHGPGSSSTMPRRVLFPTVDPSDSSTHNDVYRAHAQAYRVVLDPGDMLFLPALWYHQIGVLEIGNASGVNVSMNYWYTASATSGLSAHWGYVRLTALLLRGYHDYEYFDEADEEDY